MFQRNSEIHIDFITIAFLIEIFKTVAKVQVVMI